MTSRNNREVSAQPELRKPSSDSDRGRKRDRSVLTTTVGGSVCRDQSKGLGIVFKKPRCSSPVGGSGCRDRSKSLIITFKKPRLPKQRLRAKKVPSKGAAPPAAEHSSDSTPLTLRGRKRDRSVLTTPVGGSVCRDRSKSLIITFKKPRLLKRQLRAKKVPSRGAAPPAANVTTPTSSLAPPTPSMAPPTPSSAPPTPSLAPPTYSMTPPTPSLTPPTPSSAPPTPLIPPTPPLAPPTPSLAAPTPSLAPPTPSLAPPSITEVWREAMWIEEIDFSPRFFNWDFPLYTLDFLRDERSREQGSEEHLWKQDSSFCRFMVDYVVIRSLDEGKVKQRIVQLLRRDERSRQQDSEEHLQKEQDLSSLFRDMEESGELWRMEKRVWRLQRPTSLREDVDKAVGHFLLLGDEARLRKERQRLYRFQKLLEQWSEAFTRGKHGVSFRVGECLKDVLAEVHKEISSLSWVESVQRSESGDKMSRQQDSEEHLQKQQDLNSLFRDIEKSGVLRRSFPERLERLQKAWRLHRYSTLRKLHGRSSENFILMGGTADQKTEDPTGVSSLYHTGRFCQSSSGKTRRSLSVRNTRKYLRRVHTRTAGGALRRGPQPDCKLES